jgi:hypothetical protein
MIIVSSEYVSAARYGFGVWQNGDLRREASCGATVSLEKDRIQLAIRRRASFDFAIAALFRACGERETSHDEQGKALHSNSTMT